MRAVMIASAMAALAAPAAAAPDVIVVRDVPADCQHLGEVRSRSWWGGAMSNVGYSRALSGLKKRAVELGATHLVLVDSSAGMAGSNMLGQAYRCTSEPATHD